LDRRNPWTTGLIPSAAAIGHSVPQPAELLQVQPAPSASQHHWRWPAVLRPPAPCHPSAQPKGLADGPSGVAGKSSHFFPRLHFCARHQPWVSRRNATSTLLSLLRK